MVDPIFLFPLIALVFTARRGPSVLYDLDRCFQLTLEHASSAARGLGYSMAQALCEVGVKGLAIIDVQQDLGDAAAAELHEATGVPVKFYKVDVRDANAVSEVVGNVVDTFGSIDVLISSAGIAE